MVSRYNDGTLRVTVEIHIVHVIFIVILWIVDHLIF